MSRPTRIALQLARAQSLMSAGNHAYLSHHYSDAFDPYSQIGATSSPRLNCHSHVNLRLSALNCHFVIFQVLIGVMRLKFHRLQCS
jgi:hypothetical protein